MSFSLATARLFSQFFISFLRSSCFDVSEFSSHLIIFRSFDAFFETIKILEDARTVIFFSFAAR